jgi:hypothetical protein
LQDCAGSRAMDFLIKRPDHIYQVLIEFSLFNHIDAI